jgi:hypothetical protein
MIRGTSVSEGRGLSLLSLAENGASTSLVGLSKDVILCALVAAAEYVVCGVIEHRSIIMLNY